MNKVEMSLLNVIAIVNTEVPTAQTLKNVCSVVSSANELTEEEQEELQFLAECNIVHTIGRGKSLLKG